MIAETVCCAVSAAGLGIAAVTAFRKRFLAAARITAYSLVPVALVMTGVVGWASDKAFSPVAWAGLVLLGGAWGLFALTRAVERRGGTTRKERRAARDAERPPVAAPGASAPALGSAAGRPSAAPAPAARKSAGGGGDDFSDIEAILKKHGI